MAGAPPVELDRPNTEHVIERTPDAGPITPEASEVDQLIKRIHGGGEEAVDGLHTILEAHEQALQRVSGELPPEVGTAVSAEIAEVERALEQLNAIAEAVEHPAEIEPLNEFELRVVSAVQTFLDHMYKGADAVDLWTRYLDGEPDRTEAAAVAQILKFLVEEKHIQVDASKLIVPATDKAVAPPLHKERLQEIVKRLSLEEPKESPEKAATAGDDDDDAGATVQKTTTIKAATEIIDPSIAERNGASETLRTRLIDLASSENNLDNGIFDRARTIIQQHPTAVIRVDVRGSVILGLPMSAQSKDITTPLLMISPKYHPHAVEFIQRIEHDAYFDLKKPVHCIAELDPALFKDQTDLIG